MAGRMSPGCANVSSNRQSRPFHPRGVDVATGCHRSFSRRARLGIEADVPDPSLVVDLALRADPSRRRPAKCAIHFCSTRQSASSAGRPRFRLIARSWPLVAVPVRARVARCRGCRGRRCARGVRFCCRSSPQAARNPPGRRQELDRGLVRSHHRAFGGDGDLLRSEQHLGGARRSRSAAAPRMCRSRISVQLVDEERRARRRPRETARGRPPRASAPPRSARGTGARCRSSRARRRRRSAQSRPARRSTREVAMQLLVQRELGRA